MKRGKFIVLEGLDRSGKSSVVKTIRDYLEKIKGEKTILMNFPNRQTEIGSVISSYLKNATDISDHAIHLLFSANRWEKNKNIQDILQSGVNIICDRYWFSGVAYSCAKGLDYQWCVSPDRGLVKPNLVIFLEADPQIFKTRPGYGQQKYERIQFQKKVNEVFHRILTTQPNLSVQFLPVEKLTIEQVEIEAQKLIQNWLN